MSRAPAAKTAPVAAKKGGAPTAPAAPAPDAAPPAAADATGTAAADKPIRSVGPTFIPAK
jgi:hypothetical protein